MYIPSSGESLIAVPSGVISDVFLGVKDTGGEGSIKPIPTD